MVLLCTLPIYCSPLMNFIGIVSKGENMQCQNFIGGKRVWPRQAAACLMVHRVWGQPVCGPYDLVSAHAACVCHTHSTQGTRVFWRKYLYTETKGIKLRAAKRAQMGTGWWLWEFSVGRLASSGKQWSLIWSYKQTSETPRKGDSRWARYLKGSEVETEARRIKNSVIVSPFVDWQWW